MAGLSLQLCSRLSPDSLPIDHICVTVWSLSSLVQPPFTDFILRDSDCGDVGLVVSGGGAAYIGSGGIFVVAGGRRAAKFCFMSKVMVDPHPFGVVAAAVGCAENCSESGATVCCRNRHYCCLEGKNSRKRYCRFLRKWRLHYVTKLDQKGGHALLDVLTAHLPVLEMLRKVLNMSQSTCIKAMGRASSRAHVV